MSCAFRPSKPHVPFPQSSLGLATHSFLRGSHSKRVDVDPDKEELIGEAECALGEIVGAPSGSHTLVGGEKEWRQKILNPIRGSSTEPLEQSLITSFLPIRILLIRTPSPEPGGKSTLPPKSWRHIARFVSLSRRGASSWIRRTFLVSVPRLASRLCAVLLSSEGRVSSGLFLMGAWCLLDSRQK